MNDATIGMAESYGAEIAKAIKPDASESDVAAVVELLSGFAEIVCQSHRSEIIQHIADFARPQKLVWESWKTKVAVSEHGTLINTEFQEQVHAEVEKLDGMLKEVSARADAVVTTP